MIEHEVRMTLYTEEMAAEVSDLAARMGKDVHIHIKLDTGMSRLGFPICEESADAIERISKMPHLQMEGMFTHFAKADEEDKSFTENAAERLSLDEAASGGKMGFSFPTTTVLTVRALLMFRRLIWIWSEREFPFTDYILPEK